MAVLLVVLQGSALKGQNNISLSCKENNDLYQTLKKNRIVCLRYNTPDEAIDNATDGTGVMILADGYPDKTTELDSLLFKKVFKKNLRVYVEYPSYLPGLIVAMDQWNPARTRSDATSLGMVDKG